MKLTTQMLVEFTGQDVFDSVAWPLLHQNERSTAFDGVRCMYRSPDGRLRCAVGWLMPDTIYSPVLEFLGVRDVASHLMERGDAEAAAFALLLHGHHNLLCALQEMHDSRRPDEWPNTLRLIAQRFHLDAGVVSHCERAIGRVVHAKPRVRVTYRPVAPGYLLDLARDDGALHAMPETLTEADDVLA